MYDGQLTVEKAAGTSRTPGTRIALAEGCAAKHLCIYRLVHSMYVGMPSASVYENITRSREDWLDRWLVRQGERAKGTRALEVHP